MTDRTYYWHPLTSSYLHASEANVWAKICSQPPAICIAINRVRAAQVREIRHKGHMGVVAGLWIAVGFVAIVWAVTICVGAL